MSIGQIIMWSGAGLAVLFTLVLVIATVITKDAEAAAPYLRWPTRICVLAFFGGVIGTTNRFDRLDPALVRRFPLQYELKPLVAAEVKQLAQKFFSYAGVDSTDWLFTWCSQTFGEVTPASSVVKECTNEIVKQVLTQQLLE